MSSTSRWRLRTAAAVGCAWLIAVSALLTMLVCVDEISLTRRELDDDVNDGRDIAHRPIERKPQGHYDQDYIDDVSGRMASAAASGDDTAAAPHKAADTTPNDDGNDVIEDKIFWSRRVERLIPTGLTDDQWLQFVTTVPRTKVAKIESAKWNRCGRPKNKFVTLEDGTLLCARYRHPANTLVQGELLTFHLSRLLRFDNVPATLLSVTDSGAPPWSGHNLTHGEWQSDRIVTLTQWIHHLGHARSRVHMPSVLLSAYTRGQPLSTVDNSTTDEELISLVQWSDLVLFDYITGHYDRVASMQDGAMQESNPDIMRQSVRNLRRHWPTGKLWLLDNESGLLDAYMLLYGPSSGTTGSQFHQFHRQLL